jgi:hypothetical protein
VSSDSNGIQRGRPPGTTAATVSLVTGLAWWGTLLALYLSQRNEEVPTDPGALVATALFFLPFIAVVFGIVALRRLRRQVGPPGLPPPPPERGGERKRRIQSVGLAWSGLVLGGIGPAFLLMIAMDQGL